MVFWLVLWIKHTRRQRISIKLVVFRRVWYIVNNYPLTKNKLIQRARFHRAHSSVYVPSVINRFIFGYGMVIYFIMQSSFEKISKTHPVFLLKEKNPISALLFIFTAAAAITPHTKSYEIPAMTMHSFVKFNFSSPSVSLRNLGINWHHKTLLSLTSFARYIALR